MKAFLIAVLTLLIFFLNGCSSTSKNIEPKSYLYAAYNTMEGNFTNLKQALNASGFEIRTNDFQVGVISTKDKTFKLTPTEESNIDSLRINVNIHQDRNSIKVTLSYLCGIQDNYRFCHTKDSEALQRIENLQKAIDQAMAEAIK